MEVPYISFQQILSRIKQTYIKVHLGSQVTFKMKGTKLKWKSLNRAQCWFATLLSLTAADPIVW